MAFGSDNQSPVHAKVMASIAEVNNEKMPSYGADEATLRAEQLIKEVFETEDLDFYIVTTGGAANGLSLSAICPAWGAVLCHSHAHIIADEGNGPEFFTGGARLIGLDGVNGKLTNECLKEAVNKYPRNFVHGPQIHAVSITNLSENGLIYSPDEISQLSKVCRTNNWPLHCDGARFANAVASSGASPADLSWRSGIDALSFGLTKNGALMAESVILFGKSRNQAAPYLRKRAGQLISKQRYLGAQFVAMLETGLWLELGTHANLMAQKLAQVFIDKGYQLSDICQGNEVFVKLPDVIANGLRENGLVFYDWPAIDSQSRRFVCGWETTETEILRIQSLL